MLIKIVAHDGVPHFLPWRRIACIRFPVEGGRPIGQVIVSVMPLESPEVLRVVDPDEVALLRELAEGLCAPGAALPGRAVRGSRPHFGLSFEPGRAA